jgi:hypothetical protein
MILGILFPLIGLIIPFASWVLSMILSLFLSYLIIVIDLSAKMFFAKIEVPVFVFIILYVPLVLFILFQKRKKDLEFFI